MHACDVTKKTGQAIQLLQVKKIERKKNIQPLWVKKSEGNDCRWAVGHPIVTEPSFGARVRE